MPYLDQVYTMSDFNFEFNFHFIQTFFLYILVYCQSLEMQDLRDKLDIMSDRLVRLNIKIRNLHND
jgi:hypothetical protein